MKKGRTAALLGLAGALTMVVAAAAVTWRPLLARWFLADLESADGARRISAADWLGTLRFERAAPALFEAVGSGRIPEDAGTVALCRIGQPAAPAIMEALRDGNRRVRKVATESLLAIEPRKYGDLGEHLRNLFDAQKDQAAIQALAHRFPSSDAGISALIGCVMDLEFTWGHFAAEALGEIGPDAAAALPYLLRVLKGNHCGRGGEAALALVEIGYVRPEAILPGLLEALADRGSSSRTEMFGDRVIGALAKLGPLAKDAIPALIEVLTGSAEQQSDRVAAAWALVYIGRGDRRLIKPFIEVLRGEEESLRYPAAKGLSASGKEAVRPLIETLRSGSDAARRLALESLGDIGLRAAGAVPAILTVLDGVRDDSDRQAAIKALERIPTPEALLRVGVTPRWRREFRDSEPGWPAAEDGRTAAELLESLKIEKARHRLWKMGEGSEAYLVQVLVKFFKQHVSDSHFNGQGYFPQQRHEAADLLAELGPAARSALPAIRRALRDPEPEFRAHAAFALWKIEGDDALDEAVEAMIGALADRHDETMEFRFFPHMKCWSIGRCLARTGPKALPLMLPRLDDEDEYVRMGLLYALERLGPAAAGARPALEARLDDPHFRVRELAARALKAITP